MTARRAVKLDQSLLAEAEARGLDVSSELEGRLRQLVEKHRIAKAWEEENREAIERFNKYIDEHGPAGEEYRRYG